MPVINNPDIIIDQINLIRIQKKIPILKKANLLYEEMYEQVKAAFRNEIQILTEDNEIRKRKYANYFQNIVEFVICNKNILEEDILFDPLYDHIALIDFEFANKQYYYIIISSSY